MTNNTNGNQRALNYFQRLKVDSKFQVVSVRSHHPSLFEPKWKTTEEEDTTVENKS